jgi:hypothetical protein
MTPMCPSRSPLCVSYSCQLVLELSAPTFIYFVGRSQIYSRRFDEHLSFQWETYLRRSRHLHLIESISVDHEDGTVVERWVTHRSYVGISTVSRQRFDGEKLIR